MTRLSKKGESQKQKVIESAIYCLTNFGERGTTFQAIADHCGLSEASVVKYLKSKDNIFPAILENWARSGRETTEQTMLVQGTPEERLRSYLQVSMKIFLDRPEVNRIYLMLHYFASIDERFRVANSEIKGVAHRRIAAILEEGMRDGSFRKVDSYLMAKTIHNLLVGYLMSAVTEISKAQDLQLRQVVEDSCLLLVKK